MHVESEAVRNSLLGASGNLDRVALRSKVADDLGFTGDLRDERAANNGNANRCRLIVGDGKTRLGGMAVDELHAKNLRLGK